MLKIRRLASRCCLQLGSAAEDYANGEGGADACTDMEDPDNAGLSECLSTGEHGHSLQAVARHMQPQLGHWKV